MSISEIESAQRQIRRLKKIIYWLVCLILFDAAFFHLWSKVAVQYTGK
ncbi:hypothetical protein [Methylorubrum extorquens]|jgi:hypothetical protein|nr:hypothetical protein [Methylorubrum extorquens]MCP1540352.1 hypothetical protein [Methylorubrum extorquens]MCP1587111.1 hypothetical protein [Methylorubrum extorquens]